MSGVPRFSGLAESLRRRIVNETGWSDAASPLMRLAEPVLQVAVTVAQIGIGMWRRNGTMADSQVGAVVNTADGKPSLAIKSTGFRYYINENCDRFFCGRFI